jgi:nitrate reductase beta subunit
MSQHEQLFCSLDHDGGPGMGGTGPPAAPGPSGPSFRGEDGRLHLNLSPREGRS